MWTQSRRVGQKVVTQEAVQEVESAVTQVAATREKAHWVGDAWARAGAAPVGTGVAPVGIRLELLEGAWAKARVASAAGKTVAEVWVASAVARTVAARAALREAVLGVASAAPRAEQEAPAARRVAGRAAASGRSLVDTEALKAEAATAVAKAAVRVEAGMAAAMVAVARAAAVMVVVRAGAETGVEAKATAVRAAAMVVGALEGRHQNQSQSPRRRLASMAGR